MQRNLRNPWLIGNPLPKNCGIPKLSKGSITVKSPKPASLQGKGWNFLIKHDGWQNLYETDKIRGWFDEESLPVFKESMEHMMKIAPD